ncbi:MAG: HD domain-containing protein [Bacteroidetes bacterium]|nr:HD domain-containing protein [Bacteroidota bacterium]
MNVTSHLNDNFIFRILADIAKKQRLQVFIIGGYVRDFLLKRPSKDIDIVCVGSGIALAKEVATRIKEKKSITYYKNFGTASIKFKGWELEFVGARKESYRQDSRKPIVEDGTREDDQKRRDFTINTLAISLNEADFGELIDPFNGVNDLKQKIIRTPLDPAVTFSDDPLRMMRAIRFATQLGFDIEPETFDAITMKAERISIVSVERVTDELNKIILSAKPSYGFKLLFHSRLLHTIFPELVELQGVDTIDDKSHKDNFYHTLKVLDNVAGVSDNLWLRWSALLHDIAKPATKRFDPVRGWSFHGHEDKGSKMIPVIFRRLKLPLDKNMHFVKKMVRLHLRPISLIKDEISDSAIRRLLFEAGDDIDALMTLCRTDVTSKNFEKVKRFLSNFDKVERRLKEVELKDRIRNFQPPVSGDIVLKTFDIYPSRVIAEIKEEIKEAILDGKINNNYKEAYSLMLKIGDKMGLKKRIDN